MKHDLIKIPQNHNGFTDLFTVTHADLVAAAADGVLEAVTLDTLAFGDIVFDAMMEVKTAWGSPAATPVDTLTVSVGYTVATPTEFIAASNLITTGPVAIAAKVAYGHGETWVPYATPTGGVTMYAGFDADASGKPAETNAGELLIWMNISRWADRVGNRQLG